jgi:hypothetical protein
MAAIDKLRKASARAVRDGLISARTRDNLLWSVSPNPFAATRPRTKKSARGKTTK